MAGTAILLVCNQQKDALSHSDSSLVCLPTTTGLHPKLSPSLLLALQHTPHSLHSPALLHILRKVPGAFISLHLSVRDTGSAWNILFPLVHTENSLLILQNLVNATFLVKHAHAYVKENALFPPFWVL